VPDSLSKLIFQVCPIFLTGGVASQQPGSILPLMWLTNRSGDSSQGFSYNVAQLPPLPITDLDDSFGSFNVIAGGTLVNQNIATYPFANQSIAANATVREPLSISVFMDTPMRTPRGVFGTQGSGGQIPTSVDPWSVKIAIMTALKGTLDLHNNLGGTYTVFTPAYMYTNLIMKSLTDASRAVSPNNNIPQNSWKFEFEKPLITLDELNAAVNNYNLFMSKIASGVAPTTTAPSGIQVGVPVGQSPALSQYLTQSGLYGLITSTGLGAGYLPALSSTTTIPVPVASQLPPVNNS
jgi:hypothetical protein